MNEDPDRLTVQIGLRVLRRRQELGLTQTALAKIVGMTQGHIPDIEHGARNLTIRSLCRLANALDTTFDELVIGASLLAHERDQGRQEGKREMLLVLLRERFASLPAAAVARIDEAGADALDVWFKRGIAASSLDEVLGAPATAPADKAARATRTRG